VLEALSYGKCVLTSDIPENKEASGPWVITFKNKDVKDLKDKLEILLARKDLVNSQNKERMEYIERNYSWDKTTEDLEKIFMDCIFPLPSGEIERSEIRRRVRGKTVAVAFMRPAFAQGGERLVLRQSRRKSNHQRRELGGLSKCVMTTER
jgi:hypothetical protein